MRLCISFATWSQAARHQGRLTNAGAHISSCSSVTLFVRGPGPTLKANWKFQFKKFEFEMYRVFSVFENGFGRAARNRDSLVERLPQVIRILERFSGVFVFRKRRQSFVLFRSF